MIWELAFIFLLLLGNGVFAMAEIAIISSRKVRLQQRADQGDDRARDALLLANSPNDFLSTVQVGLTTVSILTGALGGATLAERAGVWLEGLFPTLAPHGEAAGFVIVIGGISYFTLVIGELVPKRLALSNPEAIAVVVARPMLWLLRVSSPAVAFLSHSTGFWMKLIGQGSVKESLVSEEEVRGMIEQGLGTGVFHQRERDMVDGVFRLDQQMVGDLMTPAARMVWLDLEAPTEENWRKIVASGHSQFPVYKGNTDNLAGAVSVKALWANSALTGAVDLASVLSHPLVVPVSMLAPRLLDTFRQSGQHFALVADEFGMIQGLITLHDVVEAIVGQLPDRGQRARPGMKRREDGSWLIDASMDIADAKQALRIKRLPGEERGEFLSLGGFLLDQLEHIPAGGERVVAAGYIFEVIDMDRQRIDKILATKV